MTNKKQHKPFVTDNEYVIVSDSSASNLEANVNKYLYHGYKLHGSPYASSNTRHHQAMVRDRG